MFVFVFHGGGFPANLLLRNNWLMFPHSEGAPVLTEC